MAKATSVWECQNCGAQFPKWAGKCPECGKWNSLVETPINQSAPAVSNRFRSGAEPPPAVDWKKVSGSDKLHVPTSIAELNRVLGGGLVPGGVSLIAGEPGIGKSTLLSQLALTVDDVLYINGEESNAQVANRLRRLMPKSPAKITLLADTNIDSVVGRIKRGLGLVVVDSIQVMYSTELRSAPGSIGQIRECALKLIDAAKSQEVPVILVGHFTKSGEVAGPKLLEHMVDAVLVLEGERSGNFRMLRAVKNRFGAVDEIGLFAMEEGGMREVANPAELLIGDTAGISPGSVLGCVLEGQRPLVLEVQALAVSSKLPLPRRVGHGINERRLQLLCAVIEKHLGLGIGEKDVFVNVAGGLKSQDPGLDLAVVGAIISSTSSLSSRAKRPQGEKSRDLAAGDKNINIASLDPSTPSLRSVAQDDRKPVIFCGEVGLLGEVRQVQGWERRQKEIKRLNLGKLVGKTELKHISDLPKYLQ